MEEPERPRPLFHKPAPWAFWESLGSPTRVLAPMVAGSDLPFRVLARAHGVEYCYTPMVNVRTFLGGERARRTQLQLAPARDMPLALQVATHSPEDLVRALEHVDPASCSCVDINLGCPQRIAQRGRYGAYLLDDRPLVQRLVRAVHDLTPFVVTAKIRPLGTYEETLDFCRMLVGAGCAAIAVHARSRDLRQASGTPVDVVLLRRLAAELQVPIIANGGVDSRRVHEDVLARTGCAATMAGTGLLRFPLMYMEEHPADGPGETPAARQLQLTAYAENIRAVGLEYDALVEELALPEQRMFLRTSHFCKMLAFLWGAGVSDETGAKAVRLRTRMLDACKGGGVDAVFDELVNVVSSLPDADVSALLSATRLTREAQSTAAPPEQKRQPE